MRVEIVEAELVDDDLCEAFARLLPQLSGRSRPPSAEHLRRIVASPAVTLLLARAGDGHVVGTLSLVLVPLPTGIRARVEDVVVDRSARRQGVARALLDEAVSRARDAGARDLDLTSRTDRTAALGLYEAAGFRRRNTSVFRHELGGPRGP